MVIPMAIVPTAVEAASGALVISTEDQTNAAKSLAIYSTDDVSGVNHSFGANVGSYKFNAEEKALQLTKSTSDYMGGYYRFHIKMKDTATLKNDQTWIVVNYKTNATEAAKLQLGNNAISSNTAILADDISVSKGEYVFTKPFNLNDTTVSGNLFERILGGNHDALVATLSADTPDDIYFYIKSISFFASQSDAQNYIDHGVLPAQNAVEDANDKLGVTGTGAFVGGSYTDDKNNTIATSLYVPKDYDPTKEYALLIYFHNVGGRGETPYWNGGQGNALVKNVISLTNDNVIVFAPRCPTAYQWVERSYTPGLYDYANTPISNPMTATISYINNEIIAKYNIDLTRVWAFGDSLGGGATWDLTLRYPGLLAGAVPVAGYCDPTQAVNIDEQTAIYAIHTMQDKSVNVRGDRAMTAALTNLGRNVKYFEYDSSNPDHKVLFNESWNSSTNWEHWAWVPAYNDITVAEWLVAQKRETAGVTETTTKFTDIDPADKNFKAICYATEAGLFNGTSETTFAPDTTMTRAMFVTVLGRLAGVDTTLFTNVTFDDVVAGSWYAPYVEWAASEGIVNGVGYVEGVGKNCFDINGEITIEQACVILARYANNKSAAVKTQLELSLYTDTLGIHDWGKDGMTWAIENGVYMGTLAALSRLTPRTAASRAVVASMFYNYYMIYGN